MNNIKSSHQLNEILKTLRKKGLDSNLYNKILENLNNFLLCNSNDVLEMLTYFVSCKYNPLYVNEVRNYLKNHSNKLFIEYGNRFINSPGCFEVFGIKSENISFPSFKEEVKEHIVKAKVYSNGRNKRKKDNLIKKMSKKIAIEKFRKNLENKKERQKHREEIEKLIRKQDL